MPRKSRSELISDITTLFPDNTSREISPADLRAVTIDQADSVPFKIISNLESPDQGDDEANTNANGVIEIGDIWINRNTNKVYVCANNDENAAIWIDLGSAINYLDGSVPVDGIDIDSGTIDGSAIGSSTPSSGSFTDLNVSGVAEFNGSVTLSDIEATNITGLNITGTDAEITNLTVDDGEFTTLTIGGETPLLSASTINAASLQGQTGAYYLSLNNASGTLNNDRLAFDIGALGSNLISAETSAAARTTLNLVPGTHVQEYNPNLESLASQTLEANKGLYSTAANTIALFDLTSAGRSLVSGADAEAMRNTLELGSAAQADISSDTDLSVEPSAAPTRSAVESNLKIMAWINFNGVTMTIRDSFNVSSITDLGTGNYRINFTDPMADENYSASVTANDDGTSASVSDNYAYGSLLRRSGSAGYLKTASSFGFVIGYGASASVGSDLSHIDVIIVGR